MDIIIVRLQFWFDSLHVFLQNRSPFSNIIPRRKVYWIIVLIFKTFSFNCLKQRKISLIGQSFFWNDKKLVIWLFPCIKTEEFISATIHKINKNKENFKKSILYLKVLRCLRTLVVFYSQKVTKWDVNIVDSKKLSWSNLA